jgi:sporulation protein YlmC with PRC-barrel domain
MKLAFTSLATLALLATPAFAETAPSPIAVAQAAAPTPGNAPAAQRAAETDTQRLIGRRVRNAQDETVGDINSVIISQDGSVSAVIVGVGGFLGIGEREVAIRWQDLRVTNNGEDVRVNMTKEQVRALPEYHFAENQRRGTVFSTRNEPARPPAVVAPVDAARQAAPTAPRPVAATADALSANAVIGASVRNGRNETIGRVYDVIMDASGTARTLVISSGGVLGIGERRSAVPMSAVRVGRDGETVVVTTTMTAEQLQGMPEYQVR